MYEVGKKVTSVTYMIILMVTSCSKPPSMRPISRLTDCQLAGSELWRPLWKSHLCHWHCTLYRKPTFVALWLRLRVFVCGCPLCFVWVQWFIRFSKWQQGQIPAVRPIHVSHRVGCRWTAHGRQCCGVSCGKGSLKKKARKSTKKLRCANKEKQYQHQYQVFVCLVLGFWIIDQSFCEMFHYFVTFYRVNS